jgi:hypothetical protein
LSKAKGIVKYHTALFTSSGILVDRTIVGAEVLELVVVEEVVGVVQVDRTVGLAEKER